jgi:poly(A) polymerase
MTDFPSAILPLFQAVPALADVFRSRDVWLVGGAVRDMLMGISPLDYDIVVRQGPEILSGEISRKTGVFFHKLGKNRQAVFRGHLADHTIDIVCLAGDSIESDLQLRDFTINAMAVELGSRLFIDPLNGQQDLADRSLRMVSRQAFFSDPLRLLRAYRFAATMNFEIELATQHAITAHIALIRRPAGERIREELVRLLAAPGAAGYLRKMGDSGLLYELFPELKDEMACTQNHHHRFDVLNHTFFSCRHLESFLNGNEMEADPVFQIAINGIDSRLKPILKLAMLLHDIGKPPTRSVDASGAVHFIGHETTGASMAESISKRLKLSNSDTDYLCSLVQNHLRPLLLYQAHQARSLTRKGIMRFFRALDTRTPDLLMMVLADICAKSERISEVEPSFSGFIADLLNLYFQDYVPRKNEAPLVTGRDLIALFGLSPSPAFKTILAAVEDARMSRSLAGREDALAMVRAWLASNEKETCWDRKKIDNPGVP